MPLHPSTRTESPNITHFKSNKYDIGVNMMTPSEIESLFKNGGESQLAGPGDIQEQKTDGAEEGAEPSQDETQRRIELLGQVSDTVNSLWSSQSAELDLIAQKIGDGSRDVSWRIPLGRSGLLNIFLSMLAVPNPRLPLMVQTLRIVGNTSADTDENRARVVESGILPNIVQLLNNDSLLPVVIPVLYNICVDYEPAQAAAHKAGLNPNLVSLLSGTRLADTPSLVGYVCRTLELVATQEPEANFTDPTTPFVLFNLQIAQDDDEPEPFDDYLERISVALIYLSNESYQPFQDTFLRTPGSVELFLRNHARVCDSAELDRLVNDDDDDVHEMVKKVRSAFTHALASLSAHSLFKDLCPLDGHVAGTLKSWITADESTANPELQAAACLTLGNLARADEPCLKLVQGTGGQSLISSLATILSSPSTTSNVSLIHAVLGFLKNLAIPATNKPLLGAVLLPDGDDKSSPNTSRAGLVDLWGRSVQPQVQYDAVSLTRLLVVECPENTHRMLLPLSLSPSLPSGNTTTTATSPLATTLLRTLLESSSSAEQEPTKLEAARTALTILRILASSPSSRKEVAATAAADNETSTTTTTTTIPSLLKSHSTILLPPFLRLASQSRFHTLRSELWFVLALAARSSNEAALAVARYLFSSSSSSSPEDEEVSSSLLPALSNLITSPDESDDKDKDKDKDNEGLLGEGLGGEEQEPQAPAAYGSNKSQQRADRENALVLANELVTVLTKKSSEEKEEETLKGLQGVLVSGGRLLLSSGKDEE